MLKAHNCMFMKEEMTATANSWRGIIENLYFEIDNVYILSMSLLHVNDDDCDENDCTLVMVYIFQVSESSILQNTALLHLFQENI